MISFNFNSGFPSAMLLLHMVKWAEKYEGVNMDKHESEAAKAWHTRDELPRSSHYIVHAKKLQNMGLVKFKHGHDKKTGLSNFYTCYVTKKGHAMAELLKCELGDAQKFTQKIGKRFNLAVEQSTGTAT